MLGVLRHFKSEVLQIVFEICAYSTRISGLRIDLGTNERQTSPDLTTPGIVESSLVVKSLSEFDLIQINRISFVQLFICNYMYTPWKSTTVQKMVVLFG